MNDELPGTIVFPPYRLDAKQFLLTRSGRPVALPRIPMDILLLLLRRRGELVTRNELAKAIWPDNSPDDVMQGINTAINRIRRALHDDPAKPRYVETVIGRGYRFIAPVEVEVPQPAVVPASPVATGSSEAGFPVLSPVVSATTPGNKSRGLGWATRSAAILIAIVFITVTSHWLRRPRASSERVMTAPVRLTLNGGESSILTAAISADGQRVAFADADGLHVQNLHDLVSMQLPEVPLREIQHLSWFPDSRRIAVSGITGNGAIPQLWIVSTDGASKPLLFREGARFADVARRTGRIVYVTSDQSEVWESGADGSEAHRLRKANTGMKFSFAFWTHGKPILLAQEVKSPSEKELTINPNATPSPADTTLLALREGDGVVVATRHGAQVVEGCSLPDGRMILTGLDENRFPQQQDARFDLSSPGLLVTTPQKYNPPDGYMARSCDVAPAGETALVLQKGYYTVYVGQLENGGRTMLNPRAVTSVPYNSYPHSWTPDSGAVLYEQYRDKYYLFQQEIARHDPQPVSGTLMEGVLPRVSPDGRWILFYRWDASHTLRLFHVLAHAASAEPVELAVPSGDLRCPLTGRTCVLRVKDDATKKVILYALDPDSGATRQVRTLLWEEATAPDWDVSPDGAEVALCVSTGTRAALHIVSLRTSQERTERFSINDTLRAVNWNSTGKGWFGAVYNKLGSTLYYLGPDHTATLLRDVMTTTWGIPSRNGRQLAYIDLEQDRNIWLSNPEGKQD